MRTLSELAPGLFQRAPAPVEPDPYVSETPKIRPYISTRYDGIPKLCYVNAASKSVTLNLCKHDLIHLALSIENACEHISKQRLAEPDLPFYDHKHVQVP